jgi:hypothetical protein
LRKPAAIWTGSTTLLILTASQMLPFSTPRSKHATEQVRPEQRRRTGSIDDRLVMLGSLLADLLDRTLGLWPVPEIFRPTSRMFAHTLLFAVLLLDFT